MEQEAKKPKLDPDSDSAKPELVARKWVRVGDTSNSQNTDAGSSFKVMQFNTLADGKFVYYAYHCYYWLASIHCTLVFYILALAHSTFIKCPAAALKWEYRGPRVMQEITRSGADIVCLEEVDHYSDFFEPELASRGFEGFFLPKVDSPCLSFPDNSGPDGCAFFYRSEKFKLMKKKDVILKNPDGKDSHQVALLARLRSRVDTSLPLLCVAMAHFKSKTEGRTIREAQGKHLIEEASAFSEAGDPVVIVGDFNSTTEEEVYPYFSDTNSHPDLRLDSSYKVNGQEPSFTSWKFRAKGEVKYTIDYIWYTPERLQVEEVWGVPEEKDIGEDGLPCMQYPSDHLALVTHFSFKK